MKKQELLRGISIETNLPQAQINDVLNALQDIIIEECQHLNGFVTLPKLGKFSIKVNPARQGINPKTKEPIDIPMSHTIKFKPNKNLKQTH